MKLTTKIKDVLSTKKGKIITGISVFVIVSISILGFFLLQEKPTPVLHEESYTIEYGSTYDFSTVSVLYADYDTEIIAPEVDTKKMGSTEYTFAVKKTEMTLNVIVEDTQMPTMDGETSFKVTEGDTVDYKVLKANDVVDGDLEITYTGDVDLNEPGEYKVTATAKDANNNEVKKEITVIVEAKPVVVVETPTSNGSSNGSTGSSGSSNGGSSSGNTGGGSSDDGGYYPPTVETPTEPDEPYYDSLTLTGQQAFPNFNEYSYFWAYQNYRWYVDVSYENGTCSSVLGWGGTTSEPPVSIANESVERVRAIIANGSCRG